MMALVVLVTVAGLQAVGLILVVALLIVPAVAARFWTDRLCRCLVIDRRCDRRNRVGTSASTSSRRSCPRQPAGAVIVLTDRRASSCMSMVARTGSAASIGGDDPAFAACRMRIAGDHVLEVVSRSLRRDDDSACRHSARSRRRRGWSRRFGVQWLRHSQMLRAKRHDRSGAQRTAFACRRRGSTCEAHASSRNHAALGAVPGQLRGRGSRVTSIGRLTRSSTFSRTALVRMSSRQKSRPRAASSSRFRGPER